MLRLRRCSFYHRSCLTTVVLESKPEFYGSLYSVAEKMKACPDLKVLASGYAVRSKSGSQLAFKRATAIIDYLNANYNIPRDRFSMDTEGAAPDGVDYGSRRIDLLKVR